MLSIKELRIRICSDLIKLDNKQIRAQQKYVKAYKKGMEELYGDVTETFKMFESNITQAYMGCDVFTIKGIAYVYLLLQGKYKFQEIEGRNPALRTLFLDIQYGEDGSVSEYVFNPVYADLFTKQALNLWFVNMQALVKQVKLETEGKKHKSGEKKDVPPAKAIRQQLQTTKTESVPQPLEVQKEQTPSIPNSLSSPESITEQPEVEVPFDAQAWAMKLELSFLAPSYEQASVYRNDI